MKYKTADTGNTGEIEVNLFQLLRDVLGELRRKAPVILAIIGITGVIFYMAAGFRYRPLSAFPSVIRDLALTVAEETPCGDLMQEIRRACPRVSDVELFDIYRGEQIGEGKKSMAFKIRFEPEDKALTPEDVERFVKKILGNLKFKLGAEIR